MEFAKSSKNETALDNVVDQTKNVNTHYKGLEDLVGKICFN